MIADLTNLVSSGMFAALWIGMFVAIIAFMSWLTKAKK